MKECPVCKSKCFDDMELCYGCLYAFGSGETADGHAVAERSDESSEKRACPASDTTTETEEVPEASPTDEDLKVRRGAHCRRGTASIDDYSGAGRPLVVIPLDEWLAGDGRDDGFHRGYRLVINLVPVATSTPADSSVSGPQPHASSVGERVRR